MEHPWINAFAEQKVDASIKLAIALDLQRIWSEVLREAVPTDLRRLIGRLEQVTSGRSGASPDRHV